MCTVTIIPKGKYDFVLTSNRDEAPNRIALTPNIYTIKDTKALFPKDQLSGGTWIAVSEKNRAVCVLNGGFTYHERKSSYRLSRGVVAKDILTADVLESQINTYDFEGIEPFTMVIIDWNSSLKFHELVWDGIEKHFKALPLEPRIWSSSTLYSEVMKTERSQWFNDFKKTHRLNANTLMEFHKNAGSGNSDYGVIMDRGFVKTTSITQIEKDTDQISMHYESLVEKTSTSKLFHIPQIVNE